MGGSPGQREPQIKKIVQDKIVLEFDFSGGLFNKILKFVGYPFWGALFKALPKI